MRREVNDWIRPAGVFDSARAVADPDGPDFIRPTWDSGDGMHLNDAGAEAVAGTVSRDELALWRLCRQPRHMLQRVKDPARQIGSPSSLNGA